MEYMGLGTTGLPPCVPQGMAWTFQRFILLSSFHFLWVSLFNWLPEAQNYHCHHSTMLAASFHHQDFRRSLLAWSAFSKMYRQDTSASQKNEGGVLTGVKHTVICKIILL